MPSVFLYVAVESNVGSLPDDDDEDDNNYKDGNNDNDSNNNNDNNDNIYGIFTQSKMV